ncbi:alpha/beta fold hydrolase [Cystobacter fuscus]|nr:alpha/beta hydrolase [Cystobacter fuscus]
MSEPLRLDDWGGAGPVLHFAHANGFPPGSYRKLLQTLTPRAHVLTQQSRWLVPGMHPRSLRNWEDLADDLAGALLARGLSGVVGVGHSMGGVATMIAAAKHPGLFRGVVMLDPVLFTGGPALFFQVIGLLGLAGRVPPASLAHRRRERWNSREEAATSYRKKALFRHFDPDCFQDYLTHGFTDVPGGGVRLTIPTAWEARVFETAPHSPWRWLREVKVPMLVLRAQDSDTLTRAALARVRRTSPDVETGELPGTHLFPLERPEACGQRLQAFLDRVGVPAPA